MHIQDMENEHIGLIQQGSYRSYFTNINMLHVYKDLESYVFRYVLSHMYSDSNMNAF